MIFMVCIFITSVLPFTVLDISPPRITKQPMTEEILFQVVTNNTFQKTLLIECEAKGEPPPIFKWTKNQKDWEWQDNENRISMQPSSGTLIISKPQDEDVGQYQCFARNEFGTATSNSVFVRKSELGSFKDQGTRTMRVKEGDALQLKCHVPHATPKAEFFWLKQNNCESSDGNKILRDNHRITLGPEGNLWFSHVMMDDASCYKCLVYSDFLKESRTSNSTYLIVDLKVSSKNRAPMEQYVSHSYNTVLLGEAITLFCIFSGFPVPYVHWYRNGLRIQPNDRMSYANTSKFLTITKVNFNDSGTYECKVSNGIGGDVLRYIDLEVKSKPYFIIEPEIINAFENETVELKCEAGGVPAPLIEWIHNGKPISKVEYNERMNVTLNSVMIKNLSINDTGNYGCNVSNFYGYIYKDVYIQVQVQNLKTSSSSSSHLIGDRLQNKSQCGHGPVGSLKTIYLDSKQQIKITNGSWKHAQQNKEISSISFNEISYWLIGSILVVVALMFIVITLKVIHRNFKARYLHTVKKESMAQPIELPMMLY